MLFPSGSNSPSGFWILSANRPSGSFIDLQWISHSLTLMDCPFKCPVFMKFPWFVIIKTDWTSWKHPNHSQSIIIFLVCHHHWITILGPDQSTIAVATEVGPWRSQQGPQTARGLMLIFWQKMRVSDPCNTSNLLKNPEAWATIGTHRHRHRCSYGNDRYRCTIQSTHVHDKNRTTGFL